MTGLHAVSYDDLVDRIYEAAVGPEFWPEVLRHFADAARSREGVMVATHRDQLRWLVSSPEAETFVQENYRYDGGMERTRRLLARSDPAFVTDRELFSESELAQLPVYHDYLMPSGYGRGVATAIELPDESRIIFHAEGDHRDGPYEATLVDRLNSLRPHLARSAMISARLAFERARTAVETLSGLGYPSCAVASNGKILVANTLFAEASVMWTTRAGDKLALIDVRASRQLHDSLQMIATHQGVRSIALAASEAMLPAVLHIVPVRRSARDLFSQACAILVLTTPSNAVTQEIGLLQALFDLTPIEASIAARVAAGHSPDFIAVSNGKSIETVRSQLKRVLVKTGCVRQVDLARLLTRLVPSRNGD